jgi:hypothetical protein
MTTQQVPVAVDFVCRIVTARHVQGQSHDGGQLVPTCSTLRPDATRQSADPWQQT